MRIAIGLSAALLALSAGVSLAAEPAMEMDSSMGKIYTDMKDMTLYTFDKDTAGRSVCVDKCAVNWPPFMAAAGSADSGDWSVITRPDGSKQWAHKGKPLYYWIKDQKPGDKTGDGFNNAWKVAKP